MIQEQQLRRRLILIEAAVICVLLLVLTGGLVSRYRQVNLAQLDQQIAREQRYLHQQVTQGQSLEDGMADLLFLWPEAGERRLLKMGSPVQGDPPSVVWRHPDRQELQSRDMMSRIRPLLQGKSSDRTTWLESGNFWGAATIEDQGGIYVLVSGYDPQALPFPRRTCITMWFLAVAVAVVGWVFVHALVFRYVNQRIITMTRRLNQLRAANLPYEHVDRPGWALNELSQTIEALNQEIRLTTTGFNASRQRLSLLLDHMNLGVLVISGQGLVELYNPAAQEILLFEGGAMNRPYASLIRSYALLHLIQEGLDQQEPLHDELELFIPESKFIDVNVIPFESEDDQGAVLVLLYDTSQVRRLQMVRTEFVSNASHELRTPVTAIKGFAETLLNGALDDPQMAREFVSIITKESNRLAAIISDILTLSRIEKQEQPVVATRFDLAKVVEGGMTYFQQKADQLGIKLHFEPAAPVYLTADQYRVEQILTNLIDNALNYSSAGDQVTLSVWQADDQVHFAVKDTGIGIPAADQERIFERFYRVEKGRSRNSGGTGLGLSIVRNLVKVMGGQIELESQPGQGSCFTVTLPREGISSIEADPSADSMLTRDHSYN